MIALAYLFCVLAPTLSFALSGNQAGSYCMTEDHAPGMAGVHDNEVHDDHVRSDHVHREGMMQIPEDGHAHHRSGVPALADFAADHDAKPIVLTIDAGSAKASHSANGKCCDLMCVTALPAPLVAVAQPAAPKAIRVSGDYRKLTDNTPCRLYRPPSS